MKDNYKSWSVKVEDFYSLDSNEDRIRFLINFAILAPSSHNSQPWRFMIKESVIEIYLEQKRLLSIGDKNNRQALISLGCAAENIIVAADYYGYIITKIISDSLDYSFPVISIKLVSEGVIHKEQPSHLIHQIVRRTVNRGKYIKPIDGSVVVEIKKIAIPDMEIDIISDKTKISKLTDIALNATAESMLDKEFRSELSNFVISNTSSKKYGMPGFTIGFPGIVSYVAPFMLKTFNLSSVARKREDPLLREQTPQIGIISTKNDGLADWVNVGSVFERMSLILTRNDASVAVWAAPIQIGGHFQDISKVLGLYNRPQMFLRIGFPEKKMDHSPRLSQKDVIVLSNI